MKKHKIIRSAGLMLAFSGMLIPSVMHNNISSGIYAFIAIFIGFSVAISAQILVKETEIKIK
jgi:hypothetical protein